MDGFHGISGVFHDEAISSVFLVRSCADPLTFLEERGRIHGNYVGVVVTHALKTLELFNGTQR